MCVVPGGSKESSVGDGGSMAANGKSKGGARCGGGDHAACCAPAVADQEPAAAQPKGWPSRRLPPRTRYFVMKSFNARDLKVSMQRSLWATQPRNEERLNGALDDAEAVVLFYSVNESRAFQGYALMLSHTGDAGDESADGPLWASADGTPTSWGSVFRVKWQTIYDLPFEQVRPSTHTIAAPPPAPPPAHRRLHRRLCRRLRRRLRRRLHRRLHRRLRRRLHRHLCRRLHRRLCRRRDEQPVARI